MNEYQVACKRTSNIGNEDNILNWCLGLAGEAGEVIDIIKKHRFHGHKLDKAKVSEELGDVMWYIAMICNELRLDLDNVMNENVNKLHKRYSGGFSSEKSINREV